MKSVKWMTTAAILAALAGCGAEEIESPGNSGNVTINNPPAARRPDPPPPPADSHAGHAGHRLPDDFGSGWSARCAAPSPGRPANTASASCPSRFTASTTLEKFAGLLYSINGRVDVGLDRGAAPTADAAVVLTIRPGVVLYGATGTSWLAVNRGNRINGRGHGRPLPSSSRAVTTCSVSRTMIRRASGAASCCSVAHRSRTARSPRPRRRAQSIASARPKAPSIRPTSAARRPTTTAARSTTCRSAIRATSSRATASCSRSRSAAWARRPRSATSTRTTARTTASRFSAAARHCVASS